MWLVDTVTVQRASQHWSDLPILGAFREILLDGEIIANAIELTTWTHREINALVCGCGMEGCSPEGWIALRRFADHVTVMPCFDPEKGGRPPAMLGTRGIALLRPPQVEALRRAIGDDALSKPPTGLEIAGCVRWETPGTILGDPFAPADLDDRTVLAAAGMDRRKWAAAFREVLQATAESRSSYVVRAITPDDVVVPVYLDLADSPSWTPMARRGEDWRLCPLPGFVAEPA